MNSYEDYLAPNALPGIWWQWNGERWIKGVGAIEIIDPVIVQRPGSWLKDEDAKRLKGDRLGTLEEKLDGLEFNAKEAGDPFNRERVKRWLQGEKISPRDNEYISKYGVAYKTEAERDEANKVIVAQPHVPVGFMLTTPVEFARTTPNPSFEECFEEAKTEIAMRESTMARLAAKIGSGPPFIAMSYSIVPAQPWYRVVAQKIGRLLERV